MPRTDATPAETIAFHVPVPLLREAQELADLEGWKQAEFHRLCWEAGLAIQAEKSNKRLVNKGLRAKHTPNKETNIEFRTESGELVKTVNPPGSSSDSEAL